MIIESRQTTLIVDVFCGEESALTLLFAYILILKKVFFFRFHLSTQKLRIENCDIALRSIISSSRGEIVRESRARADNVIRPTAQWCTQKRIKSCTRSFFCMWRSVAMRKKKRNQWMGRRSRNYHSAGNFCFFSSSRSLSFRESVVSPRSRLCNCIKL